MMCMPSFWVGQSPGFRRSSDRSSVRLVEGLHQVLCPDRSRKRNATDKEIALPGILARS